MKVIPYICCGDPNINFTFDLIKTVAQYSNFIELGIPFSDPIADGKTIQKATARSLKNGITIEKIFKMCSRLKKEGLEVPLVFMTYYNIIYCFGAGKFLIKMKHAGIKGLIIADLPLGEDKGFESLAKKHQISLIHLIAPNTSNERCLEILKHAGLFTYVVSLSGITGARKKADIEGLTLVRRIRKIAKIKKLFVGFGISSPEQAKAFEKVGADGIIVGSKIIDIYGRCIKGRKIDGKKALNEVKKFIKKLRGGK
ncbi:MAG: tryptophan synthase subunit alpha [Candidatus Diapherotrites archaeon CG08_land_8_20_14_0_20_34_12]|nr:MAG: tryptophan synthase subunit alpha [Candidatus Diapherotrites archaeon CG08_land_8_20_14_0_20_34_12]